MKSINELTKSIEAGMLEVQIMGEEGMVNMAVQEFTKVRMKKAEKEEKDKNYRLVERSYGAFSRSIELPGGVDADKIKATITKGVLKVTVPKPAAATATSKFVRW